jgi:hypothetical protein
VTFDLHIAIPCAGLRQAADLKGLLAEKLNAIHSAAGASGHFTSGFYEVPHRFRRPMLEGVIALLTSI